MGGRAVIKPQPLRRLPKIPANQVFKFAYRDLPAGIEGIEVVDADVPGRGVLLMTGRVFCSLFDVGRDPVVLPEQLYVGLRVLVIEFGVREETERLVVAYRP